MQCNICENEMKLIASSSKYRYFRCPVNIPFTKCTLFADQVHPFR